MSLKVRDQWEGLAGHRDSASPRSRRKLRAPNLNPSETEESFWLVGWLDLARLFYVHIPNEGKRSKREGARLKRMGLRPGASDYLILDTPPARPELKGVWVELKRKGAKPTPEQIVFIAEAVARGYGAFWIETGEAAAEILKNEYGYGRR